MHYIFMPHKSKVRDNAYFDFQEKKQIGNFSTKAQGRGDRVQGRAD